MAHLIRKCFISYDKNSGIHNLTTASPAYLRKKPNQRFTRPDGAMQIEIASSTKLPYGSYNKVVKDVFSQYPKGKKRRSNDHHGQNKHRDPACSHAYFKHHWQGKSLCLSNDDEDSRCASNYSRNCGGQRHVDDWKARRVPSLTHEGIQDWNERTKFKVARVRPQCSPKMQHAQPHEHSVWS